MQYLLLIYDEEKEINNRTESEMQAIIKDYSAFTAEISASGHLIGGNALKPVATATTVRVRAGDIMHTDGPFAETKEQLGGYYLVEAADLDEAIKIAARIPTAKLGSIEVRPLQVY